MNTLSNFFGAILQLFRFKADKQALGNTPEMKARAEGQLDQEVKDQAARDLAKGDLEAIRKSHAE